MRLAGEMDANSVAGRGDQRRINALTRSSTQNAPDAIQLPAQHAGLLRCA
jgi:hypothetical protein